MPEWGDLAVRAWETEEPFHHGDTEDTEKQTLIRVLRVSVVSL
jgi:hypothetical protein